eukprot:749927-Hanusia_phi.AAC.10
MGTRRTEWGPLIIVTTGETPTLMPGQSPMTTGCPFLYAAKMPLSKSTISPILSLLLHLLLQRQRRQRAELPPPRKVAVAYPEHQVSRAPMELDHHLQPAPDVLVLYLGDRVPVVEEGDLLHPVVDYQLHPVLYPDARPVVPHHLPEPHDLSCHHVSEVVELGGGEDAEVVDDAGGSNANAELGIGVDGGERNLKVLQPALVLDVGQHSDALLSSAGLHQQVVLAQLEPGRIERVGGPAGNA